MTSKVNSFRKEERLCSKKFLAELFQSGSSFLLYPFRVTSLKSPDQSQNFPVQVVVAVPKKRFKSSVDRNLIKRRTKEAYRLHKEQHLYSPLKGCKILLGLSYVGNQIHEFNYLEGKLLLVMKSLVKKIEEHA